MALQYKIMMREVSDLKGGAKVEKAFTVPVYTGYTELEDICKAISEQSALSSADVKGVLDSLNYVLDLELRGGRIVRMGELGNFRMSFSSKAADPAAKFNATGNITGARILFYPGKALQGSKANVSFAHVKDITNVATGENGGGSDSESPDEI